MVFENGSFVINANGQTRTYKDAGKATQVFQMLTDERVGYENAHNPEFEPKNDDQANGVEQWFQEQEATQAALKAFDEGMPMSGVAHPNYPDYDVNFLYAM